MKFFILLTFILTATLQSKEAPKNSVNTSAKASKVLLDKKWYRLNKMIDEEIKTIKLLKRLGPKLKYRLLELYTEKIKLQREKETKEFFAATPLTRKKKGKKYFFRKSRKLQTMVQKMAHTLLRAYPNFPAKGAIYYTLALNERDYNNNKRTEHFLHKSLRYARKFTSIWHNANTTLAEFYYNEKKYNKCVKYYNLIVNYKGDEWLTKHLYNMSWCLLKTKKLEQGIANLKKAHQLSEQEQYIDISNQILEAIGTFFIMAKRIDDGRNYYTSTVKEPLPYLHRYIKKVSEKGTFEQVQSISKDFIRIAKEQKKFDELFDFHLTSLELYRGLKKETHYYRSSEQLVAIHKANKVDDEKVKMAIDQIKSFAGFLQVRLSKRQSEYSENAKGQMTAQIVNYFDHLSSLDKVNTYKYTYFQGETNYSIARFKKAVPYYKKTLDLSDKMKDEQEFKKKAVNSLFAVLENGNFAKEELSPLQEYTYLKQITYWPINEKSKLVYSRLFNLYMGQKDIENAKITLFKYIKGYKKDGEIQRGMLNKIVEHHIKTKNSKKLSMWINKMEDGYLSFDKSYINKAIVILGNLLFDSYRKLHSGKSYDLAANGYIDLFNNETYPISIRSDAAYFTSIVYLDKLETKKSRDWLRKAIQIMKAPKFKKNLDQIIYMANEYHLLQDFDSAIIANMSLLDRICQKNYKQIDSVYLSTYQLLLVGNKKLSSFDKKYSVCKISKKTIASAKELKIQLYLTSNNYYKIKSISNDLLKDKKWEAEFGEKISQFYWDSILSSNRKVFNGSKDMMRSFQKSYPTSEYSKNFALIQSYNGFVSKLNRAIKLTTLPELPKFNEALFNTSLEKNIQLATEVSKAALPYLQSSDQVLVIKTLKNLNLVYDKLSRTIADFTPQGVPAEYVTQFKGVMKNVASSFKKKVYEHDTKIKNLVESGKVVTPYAANMMAKVDVKNTKLTHPAYYLVMTADQSRGSK